MDTHSTRPSLLLRLRDTANDEAWREFDAGYRDLILRYCRSRGLQPSDAEDVHQLVLLNLSRSIQNFEYRSERGRFHHYLGRIVENAIRKHWARAAREPLAIDDATLMMLEIESSEFDHDPELAKQWEDEWVNHHYRLAMQTIRATFEPRSILVFDRLLAGDGVDRVAEAFRLSTQAVHKIKQRIRARLEQLIAEQIKDEEQL